MSATATLDWWDDPNDFYRIHLVRGQRLSVLVTSGPKVDPSIVLWKPGLHALADARSDLRAKRSIHPRGRARADPLQGAPHGLVHAAGAARAAGLRAGPTAST